MAREHERRTFGRVYRRRGRPGFYVRVRLHGREATRWAGPDRKTAHDFLANLHRTTAREDLLGEKAIAAETFEGFKRTLVSYFEARHRGTTVKGESGRVDRIVSYFGSRSLCDITTGEVEEFLTTLRADRHVREGEKVTSNPPASVATRNRYASTLSVAFRLAVEKGYARANPVAGIKRPKEPKHPVPYISDSDLARLFVACSDARFRALLRVLADSGLRRSEETRLEWRDVNFTRGAHGALVVRTSKTGEPREVPLTAASRAALKALLKTRGAVPMKGSDPVWPEFFDKPGRVCSRFRRLRKHVPGFETLSVHDLRHGFCSRLAQRNVPLPTIAALAGHKSIATTMRYASHLPAGAAEEAISRLNPTRRRAVRRKVQGDRAGDQAVPTIRERVAANG